MIKLIFLVAAYIYMGWKQYLFIAENLGGFCFQAGQELGSLAVMMRMQSKEGVNTC